MSRAAERCGLVSRRVGRGGPATGKIFTGKTGRSPSDRGVVFGPRQLEVGRSMGTEDKRREFEEIVTRLTTDYPSLARPAGRPLPRHVLIPVAVVAGVVWGLLSVAMVVWGARGVAL